MHACMRADAGMDDLWPVTHHAQEGLPLLQSSNHQSVPQRIHLVAPAHIDQRSRVIIQDYSKAARPLGMSCMLQDVTSLLLQS